MRWQEHDEVAGREGSEDGQLTETGGVDGDEVVLVFEALRRVAEVELRAKHTEQAPLDASEVELRRDEGNSVHSDWLGDGRFVDGGVVDGALEFRCGDLDPGDRGEARLRVEVDHQDSRAAPDVLKHHSRQLTVAEGRDGSAAARVRCSAAPVRIT